MAEAWNFISDRLPTETDADCDGDVRLAHDESYTLVKWPFVASGAPWTYTERWHEANTPQPVLSGWINDRLPCLEDADIDGDVLVPIGDFEGEQWTSWENIQQGETWRHNIGGIVIGHTKPRTFVSVTPRPGGEDCLIAVASDGTAWKLNIYTSVWEQLPALPNITQQ
jgi:hypothetical protein